MIPAEHCKADAASSPHPARRVFAITGAGSGMGRALAIACAQRGVDVILIGRKLERLEACDDGIRAAPVWGPEAGGTGEKGRAYLCPLDLARAVADDYAHCAQQIQAEFPVLHALVHQAGCMGQFSPLSHYPLHTWHEVLQVELNAKWALTRALWPALSLAARQSTAHVLFPGLRQDAVPSAYAGAYGVAQAGMDALLAIWQAEQASVLPHFYCERVWLRRPVRTPFRLQGYPGEGEGAQDWPQEAIAPYLERLFPVVQ